MTKSYILDWKGTLYEAKEGELIDGAYEVLEFFKDQGANLYLLGKDGKNQMPGETRRLKVAHYFKEMHFVDGDKTEEDMRPLIQTDNPLDTVVVGDRIRSEIGIGNRLGATTVWVAQGRFASEVPRFLHEQPDHTIGSINELIERSKII